MDRNRTFTRREVEVLIAEGHTIVIREGRVLQLDGWLDTHPGGQLAVMHMVGRDATDEISAYHSATTLRLMSKYRIGRICGTWVNFTPPIRGGVFRQQGEEDLNSSSDDDDLDSNPASSNSSTTSIDTINKTSSTTSVPVDLGKKNLVSRKTRTNTIEQLRGSVRPKADTVPVQGPIESYNVHARSRTTDLPSPDAYIKSAVQGEIDDNVRDYPSLDAVTQQNIARKYQALARKIEVEGFYQCRYYEYGIELVRHLALFATFLTALHYGWYLTSAAFLGFFWHQIMFTAHDAGHRGITHNFVVDTLIGIFVADFCCGLSIGWWKSSHNVHHLITNHAEHDPDIQNVPLFATCPTFLRSLYSSYYRFTYVWDKVADIAVPYQRYTYYPIMGVARFNLYILSWGHLLSRRTSNLGSASWTRTAEIACMCCYWFLFGYCLLWRSIPTWTLRVLFVLVSHIITMPLHVQITLSHWSMPTADLGDAESFPQRQLRTTMDVDCPAWFDFIHGGLQFQAVHHLFPRVPRHNLRRLQVLVRQFCKETEIEYKILGFVDGNKLVLSRLEVVAQQVNMLLKCQNHMAETGESGLH